MGKDDTLYARAAGKVRFSVGRRGRVVSMIAAVARRNRLPPPLHLEQWGDAL